MATPGELKVRVGFGLGTRTSTVGDGSFGALVDSLEDLGFDSLWLSEQLTGPAPDPLAALSFAAGRTRRLKLGTAVSVVPGRNPVVLAKQMATLDRLSGGRFLPAVGLGAARPAEHAAFGVERGERAAWFDEALVLMRRLWSESEVTHSGDRFDVAGISVGPQPSQQPLEVWLGGRAPSELRRAGRLGDGWLPSFCTVQDVAEGWETVTAAAREAGRAIDPQHLGALVAYARAPLPDPVVRALTARRPGLDIDEVVPIGLEALQARLDAFVAVGASKFVVVPIDEPGDTESWRGELVELAESVLDIQN